MSIEMRRSLNALRVYRRTVGLPGVAAAVLGKYRKSARVIQVQPHALMHPLQIRVPSTDAATLEQIFLDQEYQLDQMDAPKVIVDAGANIGLASVYFAHHYPNALIVAIEPESANYEMLCKNAKPYPNIRPLRAALWSENVHIDLVDPGYGSWGYMTLDQLGQENSRIVTKRVIEAVQGYTVDQIMEKFDIEQIDILKIDIEGAEREVFANTSAWIHNVKLMIVELHERMKTGCQRSFYNGSNGFDHEWNQGESVFLARRSDSTLTLLDADHPSVRQ